MSYTIKDAEWTCDKYSPGSLDDLEKAVGFELNPWTDVLVIRKLDDPDDERDLGEVYRAEGGYRCVAWSALMELYKVFEDFDEATQWVERMAYYRLRGMWPEEIPNYEVLKTIQKLQGINP